MLIEQKLDEIRSYVAQLERDLAEADAMLSCHAYQIDKSDPAKWPENSILGKARRRHFAREAKRAECRMLDLKVQALDRNANWMA